MTHYMRFLRKSTFSLINYRARFRRSDASSKASSSTGLFGGVSEFAVRQNEKRGVISARTNSRRLGLTCSQPHHHTGRRIRAREARQRAAGGMEIR